MPPTVGSASAGYKRFALDLGLANAGDDHTKQRPSPRTQDRVGYGEGVHAQFGRATTPIEASLTRTPTSPKSPRSHSPDCLSMDPSPQLAWHLPPGDGPEQPATVGASTRTSYDPSIHSVRPV